MTFMQAVTDAIANPKQVRLSQERASARSLSGLGSKMKDICDTSPESVPGVFGVATHRTGSSFSSTAQSQRSSREPSRAPSRIRPSSTTPAVRPVALLQRSQSELPMKSPIMRPQKEFPPCITAMSLTDDQVKRNYSCDDLTRWDRSQFPLPPLNQMCGFGRYRRAVNADLEWQYKNLIKQTKDIRYMPLLQLDMEMIAGVSRESWQAMVDPTIRRDSVISSLSTTTDSSSGHLETRTRVSRDLFPSASSTESSQVSHSHGRKGSNLSTLNLPIEHGPPPIPYSLERTSTLFSERRESGPLTTIEEMQISEIPIGDVRRKIERPCVFAPGGDPDSAVASDAEDNDEWTDVAEADLAKVSTVSRMVKETQNLRPLSQSQSQAGLMRVRTISSTASSERRRGNESATTLDRNKTIRSVRPEIKRRQSKIQGRHARGKYGPKDEIQQTEEVAPESLQSSAGLELHIPDAGKTQIKLQAANKAFPQAPSKTHKLLNETKNTGLGRHNTTKRIKAGIPHSKPDTVRNNHQAPVAYVAK